ncbi:hypothetical protein DL767_009105 [Monosporascus sp. MG133]|nr:hypothetical protein DL767_009105 [Monosporascus sp. MG133]
MTGQASRTGNGSTCGSASGDHCFAGINAFLSSIPNGDITTFAAIVITNAGFTKTPAVLLDIPRNITSVFYFVTVPCVVALFLALSNVAGRTKRTLTSSFTFGGYCVGNMVGARIFEAKDAPRYILGTAGCAVCFALEFLTLAAWRRDSRLRAEVLTEEDRVARSRELGQQDYTDFENPYMSPQSPRLTHRKSWSGVSLSVYGN